MMKSIVFQKYGSPEVLQIIHQEIPEPKRNQVIVQVKAISMNPRDRNIAKGDLKFISGGRFPMLTGADLSGTITSVGDGVTKFKIGQDVFGYIESVREGCSAEFVAVNESYLAIKPEDLSHEIACTLGCAYLTALQGLRDKCNIKEGDRVAIYGASGGVGLAAIQIAKLFNADITAISNSRNKDLCLSLGADKFIAYDQTKLTEIYDQFDIFFQVFSNKGIIYNQVKHLVNDSGTFLCLIPNPKFIFKALLAKPKFRFMLCKTRVTDLTYLAGLAVENKIRIHISNTLEFEQIPEAHKMLETGLHTGKIVIKVA